MLTKTLSRILIVTLALATALSAQTAKRKITLDDLPRFREVRDPQLSPDGEWVAYVVSAIDAKEDKSAAHIWLTSFDGKTTKQMTAGEESESAPRWSPDGKFLSFTSSRKGAAKGSQVWLLPLAGGEAVQLTDVKGRLQSYEWSPDSQRLALVIGDPDPEAEENAKLTEAGGKPKPPKPIVLDRYKFKQDGQGYLRSGRHSYVYLFEVATKKLERLTTGKWDEAAPVWSPDGARIAFTSNHNADPDREPEAQLFVAEAKAGETEKALTAPGNRLAGGRAAWSQDNKWIAYLETDERKWGAYSMSYIALVSSDGAATPMRVKATDALDRSVSAAQFSTDGKSLYFTVTDDQSVYPARLNLAAGKVEKLMPPPIVVSSWNRAADRAVVMSGGNKQYNEIYSMEGASLRQLTHHNDALMAELELGDTERVSATSKDGTVVNSLLTYPAGYVKGTKVPLLLRIHGGPNGQDQPSFNFERQFFAAHGYAVLNVNYRGSSGRGQKFSRAIASDWGNLEVQDLHAAVDAVVKSGIADPDRLGVGGWSYGGILTDYLIESDNRFKAATSGAGTAFTVSYYGTDHYIIQYDNEIGPPWNPKAWETYQKLSYPFLHADRIKTPTLFLGGEKDFNVPISGSEQMYQALRSLNVDTQLVIYPNENHGISRPSYVRDRYERYLAWYDKYLKKANAAAAGGAQPAR
ncbi:MAG: S9 family peptidase [Acidobacteria bacterium]|nr:S9 family peptidase [Acidobacteriota bacterium]